MEEQKQTVEPNLVQDFPEKGNKSVLKEIVIPVAAILLIIGVGSLTGYLFSKRSAIGGSTESKELIGGAEMIQGPKEIGIKDERVFKDTAEGKVEVNDNGEVIEGSHKLIRPGGPSQTAYLTSSVLDLNQFVGRCVQVWGETFSSEKVGWLMDIGRVKVLDSCPEGV